MSTAGKIMSFRQDGNEICVKYEQQKLVVKAIRDDIVNILCLTEQRNIILRPLMETRRLRQN